MILYGAQMGSMAIARSLKSRDGCKQKFGVNKNHIHQLVEDSFKLGVQIDQLQFSNQDADRLKNVEGSTRSRPIV